MASSFFAYLLLLVVLSVSVCLPGTLLPRVQAFCRVDRTRRRKRQHSQLPPLRHPAKKSHEQSGAIMCFGVAASSASAMITTSVLNERIQDIWKVASAQHAADVTLSWNTQNLEPEKKTQMNTDYIFPPFKWFPKVPVVETLAPVLDEAARTTILNAAHSYWDASNNNNNNNDATSMATSKFTLQSAHKREVHVSDLADPSAVKMVNDALQNSLYPLIRKAFGSHVGDCNVLLEDGGCSLFLYDALIIEYDARKPDLMTEFPSQPLHRDLGLVSVNIALDDPTSFTGGGTVFERLLLVDDDTTKGLLPRAAGHALLHPCSERHAGGALKSGRRTILVCFVTQQQQQQQQQHWGDKTNRSTPLCPKPELVARCKLLGRTLGEGQSIPVPESSDDAIPLSGMDDRLTCYRAAILADNTDGESWLYLAMGLREKAASLPPGEEQQAWDLYSEAADCLNDNARHLISTDGRVFNTLGLVLKALNDMETDVSTRKRRDQEIEVAFRRSAIMHERAAIAGCKGAAAEARGALLNWGHWHATRDEFSKAISILHRVCESGPVALTETQRDDAGPLDCRQGEANLVLGNSRKLLRFCIQQLKIDT